MLCLYTFPENKKCSVRYGFKSFLAGKGTLIIDWVTFTNVGEWLNQGYGLKSLVIFSQTIKI